MVNSFARRDAGFRQRTQCGPIHSWAALFRKKRGLNSGISGELLRRPEPIEGESVLLFPHRASG
jgi:hypothetical protein